MHHLFRDDIFFALSKSFYWPDGVPRAKPSISEVARRLLPSWFPFVTPTASAQAMLDWIESALLCVLRYDDFYFLTEPAMLIYSHCAEETGWQLTLPARSRTEYEEFPLVKSFFFAIGMQFLQQNRGIVFTRRGIVTITLGFTQPTAFTFKLVFGETGSDNLQVYWSFSLLFPPNSSD